MSATPESRIGVIEAKLQYFESRPCYFWTAAGRVASGTVMPARGQKASGLMLSNLHLLSLIELIIGAIG